MNVNRRAFLHRTAVVGGAALLNTLATDNADALAPAPADRKRLTAVPARDVRIADGFWSPKLAVWHRTTIGDCFDKFEKTGALDNFDRVAQGKRDGHHGDPWWDGLVYEMISGSANFLAATPDPALERRLDGYVDRIAAAAATDPDGYLNTAVTLAQVAPRWSEPPTPGDKHDDRFPHTVYNAGCLVEAGVAYQRATGKTKLLRVATRLANYMCRIMGPPPRQNIVPGHAIGEMAFFDLCRLYRENPTLRAPMGALGDGSVYADLAQFWIDNRGNHAGGRADMGAYDQDDKPVAQQATMEGHAVRSALLAAGVVRGATVVGRADYQALGARWWENMVAAKQYVTGGLGAIPSTEGFGPDYELPNNGYCETCAAVGGGLFDQEMFLATGQAKYVDALERALYNGVLSGVALAGNAYFYTNYLASGPETRRWDWHTCPCCPPMFLKLMGDLPGLIYATDAEGVFVNLYIGSAAKVAVRGKTVRLRQQTDYPWAGHVALAVQPDAPARFALRLRIPEGASGVTATVNGSSIPAKLVADGYLHLDRVWKPGDTVALTIPLPVRRVYADHRVAADRGRVALLRGPVVYCLEGVDNGVPAHSIALPAEARIDIQHRPDLLGGVTVLTGTAQIVHAPDAPATAPRLTPQTFTAVPYYANNNREPTTTAVWLAEEPAIAHPLTLSAMAAPSASHVNPTDSLAALNDSLLPRNSDDETLPRFTWWDHRGTEEWVQYDLPAPERLSGVAVYWWDERRVRRDCRVPQAWHVEYRNGETWQPVAHPSAYGTEIDAFNRTSFDPVTTTALRLVVQLQSNWSGGILEWQLVTPPQMAHGTPAAE